MLDVLDACADENRRGRARCRRRARAQTLRGDTGTSHCAGRNFPGVRPLARLSLRRLPPARPDGAPPRIARRCVAGAGSRRADGVIRRSIEAPGTFDADGWLQIGFCGHQPGVGETYISTGSLYLCSVGLLPLGLAATDEFWSAAAQPWTSVRAWSGQAFPIRSRSRSWKLGATIQTPDFLNS